MVCANPIVLYGGIGLALLIKTLDVLFTVYVERRNIEYEVVNTV